MTATTRSPARRDVLGGAAALAAAGSAGCLDSVQGLVARDSREQVSVVVKTLPADADEMATRIARRLTERLRAAGVETDIVLLPSDQLRREVLIERDFDIYVASMPVCTEPDTLRPLLHSKYAANEGWQNPFGFANEELDGRLERQRHLIAGDRREVVGGALGIVAAEQPFAPLVAVRSIYAVGTDRFEGWNSRRAGDHAWFRELTPAEGVTDRSLRMTVADPTPTETLNPLHARFDGVFRVTDLVYDPLVRLERGTAQPWLAESVVWDGTDRATVTLREGLTWHDGAALTPEDVEFTYRFLADTSLGTAGTAVPSPRFRGRADLVERVERLGSRTVRVAVDAAQPVGRRALTVPVLPRHVWEPRATPVDGGTTEALARPEADPAGSGQMAVDGRTARESLRLTRYDDHPLNRAADGGGRWGLSITDLQVTVAPTAVTAVELVASGAADVTTPTLGPDVVARIGRADGLSLSVGPAEQLYHVGFNTRRTPLRNTGFRRTVAGLLDKAALADGVFDGFAVPTTVPTTIDRWIPDELAWDGTDPEVPYVGSDGSFDPEDARALFRDAGYRYAEGRLVYG